MVKENDLLKQMVEDKKTELYYKISIIDFKELRKHEDELVKCGEYVPNLLRSFINLDYYSHCSELGVLDSVLESMAKTRKQGREADVVETINWVDAHKQYSSILNEANIKKLGDEIEALEKEYNEFKKLL